jgi:hypothetical protein
MTIYINNEEVVSDKDFTIQEEMLNTSSVILNNVYPKAWETTKDYSSNFYYPTDYSECNIYDDNNVKIFSGIVKNTGNISLNPREPHYCNLQVVDYKVLLSEGQTLDYVIADKTISEAIQMVVDSISDYKVEVGTIDILNPNDKIGAYSTLEKTPYDVFQYLADISQSRWTTTTDNTGTLYVNFYDPTLMPSGTSIQYTNTWFTNNKIIDMSFNYGTYDYRNKQIMTSNEVYGNLNQEQNITASGYTTVYPTENKIGTINLITVNGIEKQAITTNERDNGQEADFYYTPGENQFESANIITAGSAIYLSYTPIITGRQIIQDNNEIRRINTQLNRNGIISRYENRNDALTSQELQKVGQSYLKYKGKPEVNITIKTLSNIWSVGEVVSFLNAPLTELTTDYMVKSKKTQYIATVNEIFYEYVLTSNFNAETDINYFDNQRSKSKGNIAIGETINRNIDIENSADIIFQNVTFEKITSITGDNVLNATLNAPFAE